MQRYEMSLNIISSQLIGLIQIIFIDQSVTIFFPVKQYNWYNTDKSCAKYAG